MTIINKDLQQKLEKEMVRIMKKGGYMDNAEMKNIRYEDFFQNRVWMVYLIKQGVSYSLFELIQKTTPFDEEQWAGFLDLSTKSLQRYKQSAKAFRPLQSEKIMEIAEVVKTGEVVFGDMEKFKLWLYTPNFALGRMLPIDLLHDSYGKEMLMGELTRINYGIFA